MANRVSDKLTEISEYIYCCRSGSSADTQAIADIVKFQLAMHRLIVQLVQSLYSHLHLQYTDVI